MTKSGVFLDKQYCWYCSKCDVFECEPNETRKAMELQFKKHIKICKEGQND